MRRIKYYVDHYELLVGEAEKDLFEGLKAYELRGGWYLPKLYLQGLEQLQTTKNVNLAGNQIGGIPVNKSTYGKNVWEVNGYHYNINGIPELLTTINPRVFKEVFINNDFLLLQGIYDFQRGDILGNIVLGDIFEYICIDNETRVLQW